MNVIIPVLTAGLGIWLTLAPDVLYYAWTEAAYYDRVVGPLLTAFATLTLWEVLSPLRWMCAALGIAVLYAPLWVTEAPASATVVHLITGMLVLGLNMLSRRRKHRYGGGWRSLWKRDERWNKITWS